MLRRWLLLTTGFIGLVLLPCTAFAAPVLQFEYLNSGQTYSATDLVVIQGRITNIGDADLINASPSGSFLLPQPAYDQYLWAADGFPQFGPSVVYLSLASGESVTWTIVKLEPYPITGNRGDPVPPGEYFMTPESYTLSYTAYGPDFNFNDAVVFSVEPAPSNFVWTVRDTGTEAVPEPGTWLLVAMCLGGILPFRPGPSAQGKNFPSRAK